MLDNVSIFTQVIASDLKCQGDSCCKLSQSNPWNSVEPCFTTHSKEDLRKTQKQRIQVKGTAGHPKHLHAATL